MLLVYIIIVVSYHVDMNCYVWLEIIWIVSQRLDICHMSFCYCIGSNPDP